MKRQIMPTLAAADALQSLFEFGPNIAPQIVRKEPGSLFWLCLVFVVALIVTRLYKNGPIRFGMRTLLIVTTLVAIALRLVVFAMRN